MRSLRGSPVIVTFLYTTCEDTCPTQAQQVKGALDGAGRGRARAGGGGRPAARQPGARARLPLRAAHDRPDDVRARARESELEPVWKGFAVQPQREDLEHTAPHRPRGRQGRPARGLPARPGDARADRARRAPAAGRRLTAANSYLPGRIRTDDVLHQSRVRRARDGAPGGPRRRRSRVARLDRRGARGCRWPTWSTWRRGCAVPSWWRARAERAAGTRSRDPPIASPWPRWCGRSRARSPRSSASPPTRTARWSARATASPGTTRAPPSCCGPGCRARSSAPSPR